VEGWNYKGFVPVDDHEEWVKIAAGAEGGIMKVQGFMAYNPRAP
jgi:hypothetical protein